MRPSAKKNTCVIQGEEITLTIELTLTQMKVLLCLVEHFDSFVSNSVLEQHCSSEWHDFLYEWNVRPHMCAVRKSLVGTDYAVKWIRNKGYKLMRVEQQ